LGFRHLEPLTERQIAELAEAYRRGASLVDLSLIARRSPNVVRKALARAGVVIRGRSTARNIDPFKFTEARK
jgi:hypothetical protein